MVVPASPLSAADGGQPPVLKSRVRTVAAFKNGLGFVFRAGETDLKDGSAVIGELPGAVLGALWIGTTTGRVDEVVSYKGTAEKECEATSIPELLAANVGQTVTVTYTAGSSAQALTATGTIVSCPKDRKPEEPPIPGLASSSGNYPRTDDSARGQIVVLTGPHGTFAVNKNSIVAIDMRGGSSLNTKLSREINSAKVTIRGTPKGVELIPDKAEITLAYLEKGITWTPSYLVNIANEKEADITLEAVLANDVEDLDDANVSFVVGYPNFMYADMLTPLIAQQSVASFVQSMLRGSSDSRGSGGYGGAMAQSMSYFANTAAYDSSSFRPELAYSAKPLPGESNEDLYFYRRDHVNLKKGDRARYLIFTAKASYEHIYEWEVPDTANLDDNGYRQGGRDTRDQQPEQVWHALRLENTTGQPWTTAPAFVVNGSMPVAQSVLKYIPPKGKNTLKLTVATDIRAEQSQTEASREMVKIGYNEYDSITVNATLAIKSFKAKAVKMNVKKTLTGEVLQSGEGKATKLARKVTAVNPQSEIEWDFDLEPGAEKQLAYTYKVLVRR